MRLCRKSRSDRYSILRIARCRRPETTKASLNGGSLSAWQASYDPLREIATCTGSPRIPSERPATVPAKRHPQCTSMKEHTDSKHCHTSRQQRRSSSSPPHLIRPNTTSNVDVAVHYRLPWAAVRCGYCGPLQKQASVEVSR